MVLNMMEYNIKSLILRTNMNRSEKNRKDKVKEMTTYLIKRKFKGVVTVDHAIEKIIRVHMKQRDN